MQASDNQGKFPRLMEWPLSVHILGGKPPPSHASYYLQGTPIHSFEFVFALQIYISLR